MNDTITEQDLRGLAVKKTLLGQHHDEFSKTTPFVTYNTVQLDFSWKYSIDIIALLPETPRENDFQVTSPSKPHHVRMDDQIFPVSMREISIIFNAKNVDSNLYIWHIKLSYEIDFPRKESDKILFVSYYNGEVPHPFPETTRGTVTTTGRPT